MTINNEPKPFGKLPHKPTVGVSPHEIHVPQRDIDDLNKRLDNVARIRTTWENTFAEENLGIKQDWVDRAVRSWRNDFDWRETEKKINKYANFMAQLKAREHEQTIHFTALFSEKPDAIPVLMLHGWPGSFLEFRHLMDHLATTYTPETLPVHLIVPSHTGYGFSGPPPRHDNFTKRDAAALYDQLMKGLGFDSYVVQAGDFGSMIARLMAENFKGCKAIHINRVHLNLSGEDIEATTNEEKEAVKRQNEWRRDDCGYKIEQTTRPGTLGIVVASDPVALLAWIGEKFLEWTDETPSLDDILSIVTSYWLTETFPTSLWPYHDNYSKIESHDSRPKNGHDKPVGYSIFPKDHETYPATYLAKVMNIVWSKKHETGGHFAALECPKELSQDLLDFLVVAWTPDQK